jgi:PAS domain S-box-containing protein
MSRAHADNDNFNRGDATTPAGTRNVLWLTTGAIALLVVSALVALLVVSRALAEARESHMQVQRTREVLESLQSVLSTLQDAETGERGYVITGNQEFLEPYYAAERSLAAQLAQLNQADGDEVTKAMREELARRAFEEVQFLRRVIDVRATGDAEGAAELIQQQTGRQQMDSIRALVQKLRAHEQRQLSSRLALFQERSQRTAIAVRLAMIAAILLVCVAGALMFRHIHRRLEAEAAASNAFDLLSSTMDNLSQGVAVFNAAGKLVAWNARYLELRGLDPAQARANMLLSEITQLAAPLSPASAGDEVSAQALRSAIAQVSSPFDVEAVKPDGSVLSMQGRAMHNGNYIMTFADVTLLKLSELAYRDQATRLSLILDNVVDAIITINESGSIESWSKGAARLFGYESEEVLRRNVRILMPDPHSSAHDGYIRRYIQTGTRRIIGMRREVEALHKDGRRIPVDLGISEMRIGNRRLFIGIVRDISARIEVEQLKSGFVSTVSHELRTPLTSISGSLGLLAGGVAGELPAKATRLIDIAKLNAERLVRLINDILDLEKAEAGRLEFRLEAQRVKSVVQHAIEMNRAYAQGFGVAIELDPHSEDANVLVDRDRLIQVLTNLISNAAKFSPRDSSIRIEISIADDSVRIAVRDRGAGIPAEFQRRIFEKFAQADSSDSRAKGGTGLGLSIAKTIVEQLGGTISFESTLAHGTAFFVDLPIRHQHPQPLPAATVLTAGPAVLVCEDDPDVAMILAQIIRKEGMRAETVSSARAARAALEAVRFDVAIVDLHLPDADGLEFITELRSREGTRALPVIVVTARARGNADALAVNALQLADWLQKPINPQRLLDAIRNVIKQPRDRKARILHVEDDISLTQLVKELLDQEAEVIAANSLAEARVCVEQQTYDLVILDITLGDGCGLDILPLLNEQQCQPPVILYSATEASREVSGIVQAALVKSRDSVEQLLASIRTLARRS